MNIHTPIAADCLIEMLIERGCSEGQARFLVSFAGTSELADECIAAFFEDDDR